MWYGLFHGSNPECAMNFMSDVKDAQDRPRVEPVWDQNQPAWDGMRPRGTSGELRGISGADRLFYGAVAAVALGIGIVNALSAAQDAAWRGGAYDVRTPLFWEMSSIVTIILLAPVLFVAVRRMRHASGWLLRIGLAVAAILAFSALHIAGMVGLRKVAMLLVGGSYDFRFAVATLIYEFRKDVITCLLIGGALWLIDSRREAQQARSVVTTARAGPPPAAPHNGLAPRRFNSHPHRTPRHSLDQLGRKLRRIPPRRRHQSSRPGHPGRRGTAADAVQYRAGAPDAAGQPLARART